MKSKRFMGLMALVMLVVLGFAGQAFAYDDVYGIYSESYQPEYTIRYIAGETYYNPADWTYLLGVHVSSWSNKAEKDRYYGTNCYCFADRVKGGVLSGWNGGAYLDGHNDKLVGQFLVSKTGRYPTASDIERVFASAKIGDVVQMYWNTSVHTAIISGFGYDQGKYGVWFFESNCQGEEPPRYTGWDYSGIYGISSRRIPNINNHHYSFERLSQKYSLNSGGLSIYRFGIDPPKVTDAPWIALIAGYSASYQCRADGNVSSWSMSATGRGNATWDIDGSLPPGMYLNSQTGEIYGTPEHTDRGKSSYYALGYFFNVIANNSAGSSQQGAGIFIYEPPVITTDSTLPDARVNKYYSQEFFAEGTEVGMTWKFTGAWPKELSFTYNKDSRVAKITGTPARPGTYQFTLTVKNSSTESYSKTFTLNIGDVYPNSGMWIDGSFKDGTLGVYYSDWVKLRFSSMASLSQWKLSGSTVSVISGELPPGLRLRWDKSVSGIDSTSTWANIYLDGTPKTAGEYKFKLRAINGYGGYTDSDEFTVNIVKPSRPYPDSNMSIFYTFKNGKLGVSYNDYVVIWGGTSPYTVTKVSGILPPGLEFRTIGRYVYLYGTPTKYSTTPYKFTLRATGAHNGYVDKSFDVTIANNSSYKNAGVGEEPSKPTKPKLATKKIPEATTYSEYNVQFEAGGTTPITWSFTGDLPEGFVSTDSGVIFGVPTEPGKYKFKVTATNSEGSASKSFTLKVLPQKPSITTITIPDGVVGEPYSFTVDAEGEDIKWGKSGKLPKGLKLDKTTGEISGTPTKAGTYSFTIKAKNKAGKNAVEYEVVIHEALDVQEDEGTSETVNSSASAFRNRSINAAELYLLDDGQEIDDDVSVSAGTPLTFRAGDSDDYDSSDFSGLKVYINDEDSGLSAAPDGTFTLPGELVQGSFTVYAAGIVDGQELETAEIEIDAGDSQDSSSGCTVNFAGMLMLIMSGIVLLKK